jgi:VanZ family protein
MGTLKLRENQYLLVAVSILFCILYGISDEIHQYFVPSRQADVMDALFDGLGGALGVVLYLFMEKRLLNLATRIPGLTK